MSIKGTAESYVELRGSLSMPDAIIGKSAYEIAVANGFDGTEAEWLASLKGADGKDGGKGDTGATGATGAKIIRTEYIGKDSEGGNIYMQTFDDGSTATFTAPKGEKGNTPERGTDYWTDADKAEIKSYVDDAILNGAW